MHEKSVFFQRNAESRVAAELQELSAQIAKEEADREVRSIVRDLRKQLSGFMERHERDERLRTEPNSSAYPRTMPDPPC